MRREFISVRFVRGLAVALFPVNVLHLLGYPPAFIDQPFREAPYSEAACGAVMANDRGAIRPRLNEKPF
jgi:hypothetical protein